MDNKDYYKTLGVDRNASQDEIKKSFRRLSKEFHPDMQHGKTDEEKRNAEAKFKEISEAYDVLSDSEKKSQYDRFGTTEGIGGQGFDTGDFFRQHASMFDNMFGGGFNFGFGGGGYHRGNCGHGGGSRRTDGKDVQIDYEVSFEDSLFGSHKEFDINLSDPCEKCNGTGSANGKTASCPTCGGSGMVTKRHGIGIISTTCHECRGSGSVVVDPCTNCNGTGYATGKHHVNINIPGGVCSGTNLKVAGLGQKGVLGGRNGDLYIRLICRDNELFGRISGKKVRTEVVISPITAAIGGDVEVMTPCGPKKMYVNPGTTNGDVMCINDDSSGVATEVVIVIDSLKKITEHQKKLLQEFQETIQKGNIPEVEKYVERASRYAELNKHRFK